MRPQAGTFGLLRCSSSTLDPRCRRDDRECSALDGSALLRSDQSLQQTGLALDKHHVFYRNWLHLSILLHDSFGCPPYRHNTFIESYHCSQWQGHLANVFSSGNSGTQYALELRLAERPSSRVWAATIRKMGSNQNQHRNMCDWTSSLLLQRCYFRLAIPVFVSKPFFNAVLSLLCT